jgi:gliding motility-associated-like protein
LWKPIQTPAELEDPTDLNTGVHYLQHGKNTFQLVATTGPACQPRIDSVDVWVNLVWSIPSGFSPNGDRVNDFFVVDGLDDPAHLVVLNRWGEQVFEDRQFLNNWNGHSSQNKPLPDDTYFYLLEVAGEAFDGYIIIKR